MVGFTSVNSLDPQAMADAGFAQLQHAAGLCPPPKVTFLVCLI